MSVALHAGPAGVGWTGPAVHRAAALSDVAERDQIVLSQAAASLLEDEVHDGFALRDLGSRTIGDQTTRIYELVPAGV